MKICNIKDCGKPHKAKGYCNTHYALLKRTGNVFTNKRRTKVKLDSDLIKATYVSYYNMINRVLNKNCNRFKDYGGRGISICDSWIKSFDNFFKDMGQKPTLKHSIDRIDNNGNYEPLNCKWSTDIEQVYNRRVQHNNTSGVVGVTYDKRWKGGWRARVNDGKGNRKSIGTFKTKEEAIECITNYKKVNNVY
jgi:hypothetical protein